MSLANNAVATGNVGGNLEAGKKDEELHPRSGEGRWLDWQDFL